MIIHIFISLNVGYKHETLGNVGYADQDANGSYPCDGTVSKNKSQIDWQW